MLHHAAFVTPDAAALVDFYTRVLGLEFVHAVMDDQVPSTGEAFPYLHVFLKLPDGSTIAFFESPPLPPRAPISHPAYDVFDHIALRAGSRDEVDSWHRWLVASGVDVVGPTDHGIIYSVYFHDPDGRRLELTTTTDPSWLAQHAAARRDLDDWNATKRDALARGENPQAALVELIRRRSAAKTSH